MKIVTIVRTRDEARNIERFCEHYQWVDAVLVADGGSLDDTVSLAQKYKNVKVRNFPIKVPMENGLWRNPHGAHINFLSHWARFEENADWIIFDDCDCVPNYLLVDKGRELLEQTDKDYVYAVRVYLWGEDRHFPNMAQPHGRGKWEPSIWAWRASTRLHFREDHPEYLQEMTIRPPEDRKLNLLPPYCLIHRPWPTEEFTNQKIDFYRNSGQIRGMRHPLDFAGPLEPLPDFVRD